MICSAAEHPVLSEHHESFFSHAHRWKEEILYKRACNEPLLWSDFPQSAAKIAEWQSNILLFPVSCFGEVYLLFSCKCLLPHSSCSTKTAQVLESPPRWIALVNMPTVKLVYVIFVQGLIVKSGFPVMPKYISSGEQRCKHDITRFVCRNRSHSGNGYKTTKLLLSTTRTQSCETKTTSLFVCELGNSASIWVMCSMGDAARASDKMQEGIWIILPYRFTDRFSLCGWVSPYE